MSSYARYIKRGLDFIVSLSGIFILSPIFLILMVLIKFDSKGPILFKQTRVGINKKTFNMFKFRTMRVETPNETPTHLLENPDLWITALGKVLRKTSLDELPQLFNILIGDMSFIGPRPALWNQFDLIEAREKAQVNRVLPGLTGWAQINGRDELSIETKVNFDVEYIKRMNLFFDLKCFLLTILKVIQREGIVEGKVNS